MKVVFVLLGAVLTATALQLPSNLNWKYGERPKNSLEANLREYLCKFKIGIIKF